MRKIDYTTIASELRATLRALREQCDKATNHDAIQAHGNAIALHEATIYRLANKLHVDRDKFIFSCFNGV